MQHGGSNGGTIVSTASATLDFPVVPPPSATEEVATKLDAARERLLALRRQQEELERAKGELEELRRRQDEYVRGKAEMVDNLARGLVTLERQQVESQRLAESCAKTSTAFREYLDRLQVINDEAWTADNLRPELGRALGVIDDARMEFNRARTKLDCLNPAAGQPAATPVEAESKMPGWDDLLRYACLGAAASALLIIAGTLWLLVFLAVR